MLPKEYKNRKHVIFIFRPDNIFFFFVLFLINFGRPKVSSYRSHHRYSFVSPNPENWQKFFLFQYFTLFETFFSHHQNVLVVAELLAIICGLVDHGWSVHNHLTKRVPKFCNILSLIVYLLQLQHDKPHTHLTFSIFLVVTKFAAPLIIAA